jgi:uncharacterized LabA/DUF88 family protein
MSRDRRKVREKRKQEEKASHSKEAREAETAEEASEDGVVKAMSEAQGKDPGTQARATPLFVPEPPPAPPPTTLPVPGTACYVDYENIFYSLKKQGLAVSIPKLARILNRLCRERTGQGFLKTAVYACWDRIIPEERHAQDDWSMVGWRTVSIPTREDYLSGQPIKNLVDFIMCLDIMEDGYAMPIELFFIISGDRDFVEIVERLKRRGKMVHIVSLRPNLSFRLREAADEYSILEHNEITGDEPLPIDTYQAWRRSEQRKSRHSSIDGGEPEDEFQLLIASILEAQKDQKISPVLWSVVRDEYFLKKRHFSVMEADAFMQSFSDAGFVEIMKKRIPGRGIHTYISIPGTSNNR